MEVLDRLEERLQSLLEENQTVKEENRRLKESIQDELAQLSAENEILKQDLAEERAKADDVVRRLDNLLVKLSGNVSDA